jgi:hypothetical protein
MKKKRVQVAFTESQWKLIENFRGEFGESDSDIVRNIILAWLAEKSFISTVAKSKLQKNNGHEHE